jgi:hypothetical protein
VGNFGPDPGRSQQPARPHLFDFSYLCLVVLLAPGPKIEPTQRRAVAPHPAVVRHRHPRTRRLQPSCPPHQRQGRRLRSRRRRRHHESRCRPFGRARPPGSHGRAGTGRELRSPLPPQRPLLWARRSTLGGFVRRGQGRPPAPDVLFSLARLTPARRPIGARREGALSPAASLPSRHGFADQKAPQAHAQEEAQEDAEGDPLATPSG